MLSYCSFIFLAFAMILVPRVAPAQESTFEEVLQPTHQPTEDKNDDSDESAKRGRPNEQLFVQEFKKRRNDLMLAVANVRSNPSYENRYKMIAIICQNSINVIKSYQHQIEGKKFVPGNETVLEDKKLREALAMILENTSILGDVILQVPEISRRLMKTEKVWNSTIHWSLKFADQTKHLMDKQTVFMLDLVRQELYITPRRRTFKNPFRPESEEELTVEKYKKNSKRKNKTKKNKGPRLAKIEL